MHSTEIANTIYSFLLQDFPESLVMTLAVFSLLNLRLLDRRVLYISLLQTLTNLVSLLPVAFGIHTIVLIVSLVIYTRIFTKEQISKIFLMVLICSAIVIISEMTYANPLLKYTGLSYITVFNNPFLKAAFSLPYELLLLGLALAKDWYNRKKGLIRIA